MEKKIENDENIFGEYIDTDKEIELENKKKLIKRHIKIDLDKNNYYNFLVGGLTKHCQVRKGINGNIENYEEKKDDIYSTQIVFQVKPIIKKYNKDNIKINKNYILCENLKEEEIVPELYEDEINYNNNEEEEEEELNENYIKDLANSLRSSIDKSVNSSINNSIRQSYNQPYNQSYNQYTDGIYDSIHGSKLKIANGKGIIGKMAQVIYTIEEMPENLEK